jgi:hypothetical protein
MLKFLRLYLSTLSTDNSTDGGIPHGNKLAGSHEKRKGKDINNRLSHRLLNPDDYQPTVSSEPTVSSGQDNDVLSQKYPSRLFDAISNLDDYQPTGSSQSTGSNRPTGSNQLGDVLSLEDVDDYPGKRRDGSVQAEEFPAKRQRQR